MNTVWCVRVKCVTIKLHCLYAKLLLLMMMIVMTMMMMIYYY